MSALTTFAFESAALRTLDRDGQPWFVAADVAAILGFKHAPHMVRVLQDDEKGVHKVDTLGGPQEAVIVSESGLYACIFKSRRPEAQRFRRWVTEVVLPAIRRTGRYEDPTARAQAGPGAVQFLSHGADIQVAADRTFRAITRSGRVAGLPLAAALRRANAVTLARTGIDMLADLDAEDHLQQLESLPDAPGAGPHSALAGVLRFLQALEARSFDGFGTAPARSSQWHRLYVAWCAQQGEQPYGMAPALAAMRRTGLRAWRKRWLQDGVPRGPSTFLFPAAVPPLGVRREAEWLGECVQHAEYRLRRLEPERPD